MTSRPSADVPRQPAPEPDDVAPPRRRRSYQRQGIGEATAKSFIRSVAASLGRILVRAILGRSR